MNTIESSEKSSQNFFIVLLVSLALLLTYNISISRESLVDDDTFCGVYPEEENILIDNIIWQIFQTPKGMVNLLNAYLDTRWNKTIVKINANGPKLNATRFTIFCQFWNDEFSPSVIVRAEEIQSLWTKSTWPKPANKRIPYLIYCPLESAENLPKSVSVTMNPCDKAENKLKIIDNHNENDEKHEFGLCVKQITYEGRKFARKFIEWVHLIRLLGAHKIHLYNRYVHYETYRIMDYFEKKGFIEVKPFLEPSKVPDILHSWEARTLEVNMLTDCFYRVRNLYKYIVIIDPDEVIMPMEENILNWHDLLESFQGHEMDVDAYLAHSIIFPPRGVSKIRGIPDYYYMLRHLRHAKKFLNYHHNFTNYKSILKPDNIISVLTHGCLKSYDRYCKSFAIPENICQLNHYRDKAFKKSDMNAVKDRRILKFRRKLMKLVKKTLNETGFEP